jgi:hypothetical protein
MTRRSTLKARPCSLLLAIVVTLTTCALLASSVLALVYTQVCASATIILTHILTGPKKSRECH